MVSVVRFGPAGIPIACHSCSTLDGIEYVSKIGLDAFEVEFVRGVKMGESAAKEVGEIAKKHGIILSCHAPYWINCCAKEERKIAMTIRNLFETARAAHAMGAWVIVFHPGYYMGREPKVCEEITIQTLDKLLAKMKDAGIDDVTLGAETTGKNSQYGSLDEIISLSRTIKEVVPVIDFAHMHAREGGWIKSEKDYAKIFEKWSRLKVKRFHSHFSEIEYGKGGEIRHLELGTNNEPPFKELAGFLSKNNLEGTIICETPLLEQDAIKMQKIYRGGGK
ncbi:MAG: TIM barrel protein [Candidatus Micrarchaeia archaeon]